MKKICMLFLCLVALLPAVADGTNAMPTLFRNVDKSAMNAWVEATFNKMTPAERVSQLFIMAISPKNDEATRALVKKYVADNKVGGLIYMESNMNELAQTTNYAQSLASVPLLMTIDGEWGLAMRLPNTPNFGRNLSIGSIADETLLYKYGLEAAREFRRIGLHVNFSPVLDVNDNSKNPVIGTRSFGESPEAVARLGVAYARGLEDGGVIAVGKHFPGHGAATEDSHKTLPTIAKSMNELNSCELVPFKRFIDAGLSGILTAHLSVDAIDKSRIPTTMSYNCITELLKHKMNFNGLVFTDALNMNGALAMEGSPCVNALAAGNDVLLMPVNADTEVEAVLKAIADGKLNQRDIDERCKKMLQYKYALSLTTPQSVDLNNLDKDINSAQSQVVLHKLAAASVTVIKNTNNVLPIKNLPNRKIAVVTMGNDKGLASMFHDRADDYAEVTSIDFKQGDSQPGLVDKIKTGKFNTVVVAVCGEEPIYRTALQKLASECDNLIVTLLCQPYDIQKYADVITNNRVKAVLLTYNNGDLAEDYAVQTIFGGNAACGKLPISLVCGNKKYNAGYGLTYNATRLGYTIPAEVGMDNILLHQIDSVAQYALSQKAFPGCQVVVGRHGKIVCKRSYGETAFGNGVNVTDNTLYGLASVSKATGTLSAVMKVFDDGKFKLNDRASKYIAGLQNTDKEDLTFTDLLYHETGMPPSLSMWQMMMDPSTYTGSLIVGKEDADHNIKIMKGAYGHKDAKLRTDILSNTPTDVFNIQIADGIWGGKPTYDSIMNRIYSAQLGKKRYLYSCLNFCLLANAVQNITKTQLNDYVNTNIFAPLGSYHTMYRPLTKFDADQIAYTEFDTYLRRQHIHGYVHDELAAFSGGVQGNAGLFSTANDLAKLMQMLLNGGTYGSEQFYKPSTVKVFMTSKSPNSHRGLGYDKPIVDDPEDSSTCPEATAETVGHTGFTGTCFWIDPKNDMFYIFLSNRVSPTRDNPAFSRVSARSHIQTLIYKSLVK
ncbi:MAG: serine hydrolase [Bacteroidales bacterium]|nr:serine hydrolase [Candidatus Sodaliphilus aphodohippi]